ncbi:DUF805 domain-containing protein [Pseudoalteromonas sp. XMcav1-K]|uniref:DUF805 domain-containing protein n=1 Tax=Pseudoalteromonas sp. XMcav1-K TaxID=3374372 RepID=UPI003757E393
MNCSHALYCVEDFLQIAYLLSNPIFASGIVILAFMLRNIPGRPWLISFAALSLFSSVFYSAIQIAQYTLWGDLLYLYKHYNDTMSVLNLLKFNILFPCFLLNLWTLKNLNIPIHTLFFSWRGRATRSMFWGISLLYVVLCLGLFNVLNNFFKSNSSLPVYAEAIFFLVFFFTLCVISWMTLMIHIKRWHDCNQSGWMMFLSLIPVIGPIGCMLYLGFAKGTDSENKYGHPVSVGAGVTNNPVPNEINNG